MDSLKKLYEYLSNHTQNSAIGNEMRVEVYVAMYKDLDVEGEIVEVFAYVVHVGNPLLDLDALDSVKRKRAPY